MTYDELKIGDSHSFGKTISEFDIYAFAGVSGDFNPMHVNEVYAKNTTFGGRIAHGILTAGLISAALSAHVPGPGGIYLEQTLKFCRAVYVGDTITAVVTVIGKSERNRVRLNTRCFNQDGVMVLDGEALVRVPSQPVSQSSQGSEG